MLAESLKTNYDALFIKSTPDRNYLRSLYNDLNVLKRENSFFFLIPNDGFQLERNSLDKKAYLVEFSPLLKWFFTSDEKKYLITEETIFNILIQKDKRLQFLSFLKSNDKKLVFFYSDKDCVYNQNNKDLISNYHYTTDKELETMQSLKEKIEIASNIFNKTVNPFAN